MFRQQKLDFKNRTFVFYELAVEVKYTIETIWFM